MWVHEWRKFMFYRLWGENHENDNGIPEGLTTIADTSLTIYSVRVVWMLSHVPRPTPAKWELSEISVSGNIPGDRVTRTVEVMSSVGTIRIDSDHYRRIDFERPEWLNVLVEQCRPIDEREEQPVG